MKGYLFVLVLLISNGAWGRDEPDPRDVYFEKVAFSGTGCSQNTAQSMLSPDRQELTISFDDFIVEVGSNGKNRDHKNCQIDTVLHVPSGFTLALASVDIRGANYLPLNSQTSEVSADIMFGSVAASARPMTTRFQGPLDEDYLVERDLKLTRLGKSKCGENITLTTRTGITVTNGPSLTSLSNDAAVYLDTIDWGTIGISYKLEWKKCKPKPILGNGKVHVSNVTQFSSMFI